MTWLWHQSRLSIRQVESQIDGLLWLMRNMMMLLVVDGFLDNRSGGFWESLGRFNLGKRRKRRKRRRLRQCFSVEFLRLEIE